MSRADYRAWVPAAGGSRIAAATARGHAEKALERPRARALFSQWEALARAPFSGISESGRRREGLFPLAPEGAPAAAMAAAASALLERLGPDERARCCHAVDSPLWRRWQNTEMFVERHGLRLEECPPEIRERAMAVVRAGLSADGWRLSLGVMKLNRFLGDLIGAPGVLNEWSYNLNLFGAPSAESPWGWQLYGHHLALNCMVVGGQMVLTPGFWGAEVTHADRGPHAGIRLFEDHERIGLELMNGLPPELRERAVVARSMAGGDLPDGRRHFADCLHLGGAFQDNRIVPYEGLPASMMDARQRRVLTDLAGEYLAPLPDGPRQARLAAFEEHLAETHFCWIGGAGADDPFYYRIQSPVVFIEFDNHPGVFLTNPDPARFHVHTIVRTPNGNDYGFDLLRQHHARSHRRGQPHG